MLRFLGKAAVVMCTLIAIAVMIYMITTHPNIKEYLDIGPFDEWPMNVDTIPVIPSNAYIAE